MATEHSNQTQLLLYDKIRHLEQNIARLTDKPEETEREELLVALEELHVAEEELRHQNLALHETQKQMLHERQKYVTLFELSPVGHVLTTPSGKIIEANKAFASLLNFTNDFMSHKPLQEFAIDPTLLSALFDHQSTSVVEREIDFQPRTGEAIVTSVTMTPITDEQGVIQYQLWAIHDLRQQKLALQLEGQLTAQKMQTQLDAEKAVSALKSEIMQIINHNFRTPLTIIQASASTLESYNDRLSQKKRGEKFSTIYGQIRHLAYMLDEIGIVVEGVSKIRDLSSTSLNVASHCESLIRSIRGGYGQYHNIILQVSDVNQTVQIDTHLLDLILRYLINNAILYSPVRSEIKLVISKSENDLVFQVIDEGIGIPLADQPLIFKSIHRGSNVSNRPGLGLGLKIIKECAELLDGTLSFTSQENVGTTFTLRLPVFNKPTN